MKLKKRIVLLPGDGIGPEVTRAAAGVLQECAREFQHQFEMVELPVGGAAIDKTGEPLPNETLDACRRADAAAARYWLSPSTPEASFSSPDRWTRITPRDSG